MDIAIYELKQPGEDHEYISFRVNADCNLGRFLVYDTSYLDRKGQMENPNHHVYHFPDVDVSQDEIQMIRLYTKYPYKPKKWVDPDGNNTLILSWFLPRPILNRAGHSIHLVEIAHADFKSYND